MKTTKLFTFLVACAASIVMVSCNSIDDNTNVITPEQKALALQTIKGSYTGNLIYEDVTHGTTTDPNDSVSVTCQITTDSTLVIRSVPATIISDRITDKDIAAAIATEPAQDLQTIYGLYGVNPIMFLVNPSALTYNVSYAGGAHKVQVAFYVNSAYSFGQFSSTSNMMKIQIVVGAIYIDGKHQDGLISREIPMVVIANKK